MKIESRHKILILTLAILLPVLAVFNLLSGQIDISLNDAFKSIFSFNNDDVNQVIFRNLRIPRMLMALLAGGALAISGLLMQTLFKNPLAGPYVLGINSGSSLLVGLTIMTGFEFFSSDLGVVINAFLGALIFGLIILAFSKYVVNQLSLLLIGIMLGSFTSSFISILQSSSDAVNLKVFTLWGLGSLSRVTMEHIPLIIAVVFLGVGLALIITKSLNILVLGESEAKLLGVNVKSLRYLIIAITAILSGIVTAYCGPIAFVGLAVPNIVRILFKTQHHLVLVLATFLSGAIFLLLTDTIIQLLAEQIVIPINALTSIVGAPIVVLIVFRKLR